MASGDFLNMLFSGGLASVIYTDTLQTVVLVVGATILFFMCMYIFNNSSFN